MITGGRLAAWGKPIVEALRLALHTDKLLLCAILGISILNGLLPIYQSWVGARLVDVLVDAYSGRIKSDTLTQYIAFLVGCIGAGFLISHIASHTTLTLVALFRTKLSNHIRGVVVEKISELDYHWLENAAFHDKLQNVMSEASARPAVVVLSMVNLLSATITAGSLVLLLISWRPWICVLIAVPALAVFLINTALGVETVRVGLARTRASRKASYLASLLTSAVPVKELRIFGCDLHVYEQIRAYWLQFFREDSRLGKRRIWYAGCAGGLLSLNVPLVLGYAALQVVKRRLTIGEFTFWTQSTMALSRSIGEILGHLTVLNECKIYLDTLAEFRELSGHRRQAMTCGQSIPISRTPVLEFRNVSFSYPGTRETVLQDVCFRLEPGECLALVGRNGAGKSTILKLISGLYHPTKGYISLDRANIDKLPHGYSAKHIGVVLQDFCIYDMSVCENICIGGTTRFGLEQRAIEAAKLVGVHSMIEKLPAGYRTQLGRSLGDGHELSGGQRQLLALARTIVHDPPILVLDEPTSALDPAREKDVMQRLLRLVRQKQKSMLIISHRASLVEYADRCLVIEQGRIVDTGTPQELRQQSVRFQHIFAERELDPSSAV